MGEKVLITGGAGFIGSHLADALLAKGHRVRVLDVLHPQVHGPDARRPAYLARDVDLHVGDVRDRSAVARALDDIDVVYHFASLVGVGQSMYRIEDYTSVNDVGTAVVLEAVAARKRGAKGHSHERGRPRKVVLASSMSIYGEGRYRDADGAVVEDATRRDAQLEAREWDPRDARGRALTPIATPEEKQPAFESVYALNKYAQERMTLIAARAYGIPAVALRFFNVYGPRQALSNPYTGVLAIFASRLLNGNAPMIFEDGQQRRDFVSVHDVACACVLAMERSEADGRAINVGSGRAYTVVEIAARIAEATGKRIAPEVTRTARKGDIRHCYADIALARRLLGYEPRVSLEDGLRELAGWLVSQTARDSVAKMREELSARGLTL